MKRHITKEQWMEFTLEEKFMFCEKTKMKVPFFEWDNIEELFQFITIGQMIEMLEDEFEISKPTTGYSKWYVKSFDMEEIRGSVLCDLLWEAVKFKLK